MNIKRIAQWFSIIIGCFIIFCSSNSQAHSEFTGNDATSESSLLFVENIGQFPHEARFLVYGTNQYWLWLVEDGLWISIKSESGLPAAIRISLTGEDSSTNSSGNHVPRLQPFGLRPTIFNYYRGSDPASWRAGVPVWSGVRYMNLFPGVDLVVTGDGKQFTWRLVHSALPATDWNIDLYLQIEGAAGASISNGVIHISTQAGAIDLPLISTSDHTLNVQPTLTKGSGIIYKVTSPFTSYPDLVHQQFNQENSDDLIYSTFLGESEDDKALAIAVNGEGEANVTGWTKSPLFPTSPGANDTSLDGDIDIFVTRLNSAGSDLLFSTFIGGGADGVEPSDERAWDIVAGKDGAVYITGETRNDDFPTTAGAYETEYDPGYNIPGDPPEANPFLTIMDDTGGMVYSTYLGPTSEGKGIDVDESGIVYITGRTGSEWFPTTEGAYDRSLAFSGDFFVQKLNPAGQGTIDLLYSTYVGMQAQEIPEDIAVDSSGIVYVTGSTEGEFPTTTGAYDTSFNGTLPCQAIPCPRNVVFFKLDPAGNGAADLKYSTYLGGSAGINEYGKGITIDGDGKVYITGSTWAGDFPTTPGAFDTTYDGFGDAFVSKINPSGNGASDLLYSTYLGGSYIENSGHDIAVDNAGDIYIIGDTYSNDFPTTPGAFQTALNDYTDIFIVRLHPGGAGLADLTYSTFLGGDYLDYGRGIAVGQEETIYIAGYTASSDFPTTAGSYDTTNGGGTCGSFPCFDAIGSKLEVKPNFVISGTVVDVDRQPILGVMVFAGESYQGVTNTSGEYTITGLEPGNYVLTPKKNGFFFSPESRIVTIPPSTTEQNFTGVHIKKKSSVPQSQALHYGDVVTYTVSLVYPEALDVVITDPVPTYTTYMSNSLCGPAGVNYDLFSKIISGTLSLSAIQAITFTFAVQTEIAGSSDFSPFIVNRACILPVGGGQPECATVWNLTYIPHVYLPLVLR